MLRKIAVCAIAAGTLSASVLYASDNEAYSKCVSDLVQSKKSTLLPSDLNSCYNLSTEFEDAAAATDSAADPAEATDAANDPKDKSTFGRYQERTYYRDGRVWTYVTSDSTLSEIYVDPSSINSNDGFMQAWFLTDASKDKTVQWRYAIHLDVVDCAKNLISQNSFTAYDPRGRVAFSEDRQFNYWQNVVPNSVADAIVDKLCR